MGIFTFIRAAKNMIINGGNYSFIAKNIAMIYYVIENSDFGKILSEEQKLFATALCDTYEYLQSGEMSVEDIMETVFLGTELANPTYGFYGIFEVVDNRNLINVTMALEALIFSKHSDLEYQAIVNNVIKNKEKISETINKALVLKEKCDLYNVIYDNVNIWINDKDFQKIIFMYNDSAVSSMMSNFGRLMSEM